MGPKKFRDGHPGENSSSNSFWPVNSPNRYGQYGYSEEQEQQRQQTTKQMQRNAEASKQMLYGVFGNVVAILEEYEARTQAIPAIRSNISIPDQSGKTVDDVQSIVQTQLVMFETMQKVSPAEINKIVNKELRQKTIHWAAVRAEQKLEISHTDKYICQLYEVLARGETAHEFLEQPMEAVSAETIRENVSHMFKGKHEAMELDREFKNDDKKKATPPDTRRSREKNALEIGVERMKEASARFTPHHILEFDDVVPASNR